MSGIKGANSGAEHYRYKHGQTHTRLFKIWSCMRERCYYSKHAYFDDYGGRGIVVCDEWQDFLNFKQWALISGYDDFKTIDRIDVNGNYSPENCRWVTMKEQQNNKRNNRRISLNGKVYTLTQLAEAFGIKKATLKERLNAGWSVEDAVFKPIRKRTTGYRPSEGLTTKTED